MKLSTKNLLIVFGVLVVAFLIVQQTKRSGKSKSLRSELVAIDTAKATKVEISSPQGKVLLDKSAQGWKVSLASGSRPAKVNAVESMLQTLNTIKPSRLASRSSDKWKDYAVDSAGTRVQVFDGDKLLSDIVLGRFGVEGQRSFYTFVRLTEDENVYVANNFMKMSIAETSDDYRDNTIMQMKKDSLTMIRFDYPDSAFTLTKQAETWFMDGIQADSAAVANYIQGLNYVTSKSFYNETIDSDAVYTLTFSFSNQPDVYVEAFNTSTGIAFKSSENDVELFLDESLQAKLMKGKGVFATTR